MPAPAGATVTAPEAQTQAAYVGVGLASGCGYDRGMTEAEIAKLASWLAKAGLEGKMETALA